MLAAESRTEDGRLGLNTVSLSTNSHARDHTTTIRICTGTFSKSRVKILPCWRRVGTPDFCPLTPIAMCLRRTLHAFKGFRHIQHDYGTRRSDLATPASPRHPTADCIHMQDVKTVSLITDANVHDDKGSKPMLRGRYSLFFSFPSSIKDEAIVRQTCPIK